MNVQILIENGFKQGFIKEMWVFESNKMIHVVIGLNNDFIFRCYGRSVAKIKDENHLKELILSNMDIKDSFKNYPIKKQ